jgi:molybdopterin converting factor small subunit
MPQVTVNLYATFREHVGGQPSVVLEIEAGQTIGQLLSELGVPLEQIRIIFCNHRLTEPGHRLEGGETVGVFPAIGGG